MLGAPDKERTPGQTRPVKTEWKYLLKASAFSALEQTVVPLGILSYPGIPSFLSTQFIKLLRIGPWLGSHSGDIL